MAAFSDVKGGFPCKTCGKSCLGRYAVSLAGHDSGKIYLVVGQVFAEGFAAPKAFLLANGRSRKAATPKLKKRMHVRILTQEDAVLAAKLQSGAAVTDAEVIHSINCFKALNAKH